MRDVELVFTENNIHFKNNNRSVVMDVASKSLMEMYSHVVCQNGGHVLDVGFGMGFSANKMSELADTYTCIEINPQIYERAIEWAKDKPNVEILFGNWVDIIPTLSSYDQRYDGIFMDTHDDKNYRKFEEYAKLVSKEGTILSIFNYFDLRDRTDMNSYVCGLDVGNFSKIVMPSHTINWTTFIRGKFIKTKRNKIKSKQTHIL